MVLPYLAKTHPPAGVRRNAIQVLAGSEFSLDPAYGDSLVAMGLLRDVDGQVRLAAYLALAQMNFSEKTATALVAAMNDSEVLRDRWLLDAVTAAAAGQELLTLETVLRGNEKQYWTNATSRERLSLVAESFARGMTADTSTAETAIGGLLELAAKANPQAAATVINGLEKGWPRGVKAKLSDEKELALASLLKVVPATEQSTVISLARKLGSQKLDQFATEIAASLLSTVQNGEAEDFARVTAAKQLVEFRKSDAEVASQLLALLTPRTSPQLATGLVDAAAQSESPRLRR